LRRRDVGGACGGFPSVGKPLERAIYARRGVAAGIFVRFGCVQCRNPSRAQGFFGSRDGASFIGCASVATALNPPDRNTHCSLLSPAYPGFLTP
jgi:hypothetical protein